MTRREIDPTLYLRDQIVGGLHVGRLRSGDRLPSLREVARELGLDIRAVARAYRMLEAEGLVEVRTRSGVYVARQERAGGEAQAEMARWMASVLTEAWKRRIPVPELSARVRRSTITALPIRCAFFEATEDALAAFATELRDDFGLETTPVPVERLPLLSGSEALLPERLPIDVQQADLLATTIFHVATVRPVAEALGKPLVVLTAHPEMVAQIRRAVSAGSLTIVCVDPHFGERMRATYGEELADRIHVVLADDAAAVAALDPAEPVLLTRAARRRLGDLDFPRLVPHSPTLSPESARELSEIIIRLNLEAEPA
jgi:DNA-binding transcriptional regulator YhcF (GntR family)